MEISDIRQRERVLNQERDEEAIEKRKALNEQLISSGFEVAQMIADSAFAIAQEARNKETENQKNAIDERFAYEEDQLNRKVEMGINTQRVADRELIALEKKKQSEQDKIAKEAFEKNKKSKRSQALINGALAITQIFATTPPPASFILAGVQGVATGLQIAAIEKEKFTRGGILRGPSHANGGIDLGNGNEAEGGEIIINKNSAKLFKSELSAINQAGGGVSFERGGIISEPPTDQNQDGSLKTSIDRLNKNLETPFKAFVVGKEVEKQLMSEANSRKNAAL